MVEFKNLERLPQEAGKKIVPYLEKFLAVYPQAVRSILIYGSAAGGHYLPGRSDINTVILVDKDNAPDLRRMLKVVADGVRQKIPAPLLLTKEYVQASLDTFPIEFLDIQENHILIYGEDYFSQVAIEGRHLRLFCEHQIKGKLIRVRQAYLENGLNTVVLATLLTESLHSLIPVFRNLIRLKGQTPDIDKTKILTTFCSLFGLEDSIFHSIYRLKNPHTHRSVQGTTGFFQELTESYIQQLERLAAAVDRL